MHIQIVNEISPRTKDSIMGIGERMACRIVAAALEEEGFHATLVTLENVITPSLLEAHSEGEGPLQSFANDTETRVDHNFYSALALQLGRILHSVPENHIPVVTGFFGPMPGSLLDQVGRGYTDLCAALCAVGVQARELQIWKEVDGVFTADPNKVSSARLLPFISPQEAAELTHYGSEVIHPFTMEQAILRAIPIRIKNVMSPMGEGTVIVPTRGQDHGVSGHLDQPGPDPDPLSTPPAEDMRVPDAARLLLPPATSASWGQPHSRLPTAVTIKNDILVLNVHSHRKALSHHFYAQIFGVLDRHGVGVDVIATSKMHVSIAVDGSVSSVRIARVQQDLTALGTVSILHDLALVSLIGHEMRHLIGVAGKMLNTLAEGGINIELISQSASKISISTAIHRKSAHKALNLIHTAVLELPPPGPHAGHFGSSFF